MRRYCQHLLLKLSNNGGVDAAEEQMKAKQYVLIIYLLTLNCSIHNNNCYFCLVTYP